MRPPTCPHYREFDYVVVNDEFEHAVRDLRRIIAGDGAELAARTVRGCRACCTSCCAPHPA